MPFLFYFFCTLMLQWLHRLNAAVQTTDSSKMTVWHLHSDWGREKKNMCTITDRHSVHLLSSSPICTSDLDSNFLKGNKKCLLPCNSLNVYSEYRALSLHCSHSSTIKYPVWRLETFNNYSRCLQKEFRFTTFIFHFSFHGRGILSPASTGFTKKCPWKWYKKMQL